MPLRESDAVAGARLIDILRRLRAGANPTAEHLAEFYRVEPSTIRRDFAELQEVGYRLTSTQGRWRLADTPPRPPGIGSVRQRKRLIDPDAQPLPHYAFRKWTAAQRAYVRRAQAKGTDIVTKDQWAEIVERHGGRCIYCGCDGPMTMDHLTPLARGGKHLPSNVAPACWLCNVRKSARTEQEYRAFLASRK